MVKKMGELGEVSERFIVNLTACIMRVTVVKFRCGNFLVFLRFELLKLKVITLAMHYQVNDFKCEGYANCLLDNFEIPLISDTKIKTFSMITTERKKSKHTPFEHHEKI